MLREIETYVNGTVFIEYVTGSEYVTGLGANPQAKGKNQLPELPKGGVGSLTKGEVLRLVALLEGALKKVESSLAKMITKQGQMELAFCSSSMNPVLKADLKEAVQHLIAQEKKLEKIMKSIMVLADELKHASFTKHSDPLKAFVAVVGKKIQKTEEIKREIQASLEVIIKLTQDVKGGIGNSSDAASALKSVEKSADKLKKKMEAELKDLLKALKHGHKEIDKHEKQPQGKAETHSHVDLHSIGKLISEIESLVG